MAKTSKSAKSERQKLIDQAMNQKRGVEKRRTSVIITVAVVGAAAIIAVPVVPIIKDKIESRQFASLDIGEIGAAASVCQKVEVKKATGVSNHVQEPTTVDYDSAPPAYGAHWNVAGLAPAAFDRKFYSKDDRPPLEALVHNLEHGYTILWYDDTVAEDSSQITEIRSIAEKFKADDDNFRLKFIAAPWTAEDEKSPEDTKGMTFPDGQHIAFTHWAGDTETSTGVWQYCSETSGAALQTFMDDYPYTDSPESGAL